MKQLLEALENIADNHYLYKLDIDAMSFYYLGRESYTKMQSLHKLSQDLDQLNIKYTIYEDRVEIDSRRL